MVAAFHPLAEAAERVGGDHVAVADLTPPGSEPHDVELTADQVDSLLDAEVVLYVGGGFQPAVEEVARRRDGTTTDVLGAVRDAPEGDPHFWLDPAAYAAAVRGIEEALGGAAPELRAEFAERAAAFRADLAALDAEYRTGLATCERRAFVTTHAAFGFLAQRYGLEQLSVSGLSPESEPDADRLDVLAAQIESRGITTVFYEDAVSPGVAEALARETGATTAVLHPLESLTREQVDAGADYLSVMRDNLAALRAALGCS